MTTHLDLSAAEWHTSTYTNETGGSCVEVARNIPGAHPVRDTKDRAGHMLVFPTPAWEAFIRHLT